MRRLGGVDFDADRTGERNQQGISPVSPLTATSNSAGPPYSCQPVTVPSCAPVRRSNHLAADQVGLVEYSPSSSGGRSPSGSTTSSPAAARGLDGINAANLKINRPLCGDPKPLPAARRRRQPAVRVRIQTPWQFREVRSAGQLPVAVDLPLEPAGRPAGRPTAHVLPRFLPQTCITPGFPA